MEGKTDMEKRRRKPTVGAEVREIAKENDSGSFFPGVIARCRKCGRESQEIWGTGPMSVKRALASLRDGCPEDNFYERVFQG